MAQNGLDLQIREWRDAGTQDQAIARRLRELGIPDAKIALLLSRDRSTIFRWLGARREAPAPSAERPAKADAWPSDRNWPADWTADFLAQHGVDPDRAAQLSFVAESSNRWVRWFLTERIRLHLAEAEKPEAERLPDDLHGQNWRDAIAGLPVLAEWLRCPEAAELVDVILDKRPYYVGTGGGAPGAAIKASISQSRAVALRRMGYASAARPYAAAVRERVKRLAYETAMGLEADDRLPMAALNELVRRLPMVDRQAGADSILPWRTMARIALWRVFVQILKHEPVNGGTK